MVIRPHILLLQKEFVLLRVERVLLWLFFLHVFLLHDGFGHYTGLVDWALRDAIHDGGVEIRVKDAHALLVSRHFLTWLLTPAIRPNVNIVLLFLGSFGQNRLHFFYVITLSLLFAHDMIILLHSICPFVNVFLSAPRLQHWLQLIDKAVLTEGL
jgi:hypothetical protein